jgi:peroxiredoxin Q/BCP
MKTTKIASIFLFLSILGIAHAAGPKVTESAKDFSLRTPNGQAVKLSSVAKTGPVVLIFLRGDVGYQCPLCTKQMLGLLKKAKDLKAQKATVVLVYPGSGSAAKLKKKAQGFLKNASLPPHFKLVTDPGFNVVNAYGLRWNAPRETVYPSTFVLDTSRKVHYAKVSMSHGNRASAKDILAAVKKIPSPAP